MLGKNYFRKIRDTHHRHRTVWSHLIRAKNSNIVG